LKFLRSAGVIVFAIAACKLLLYFYTGRHYGHFVDELYYLACSRHLDWGYVDQPPLIAVLTWLVRSVLGQSLASIRLLPALASLVGSALRKRWQPWRL
jgi:4-amino-4-deoxy-L-arabinose transferase-like glycosyltransferase